jgi:hypothetical protein
MYYYHGNHNTTPPIRHFEQKEKGLAKIFGKTTGIFFPTYVTVSGEDKQ